MLKKEPLVVVGLLLCTIHGFISGAFTSLVRVDYLLKGKAPGWVASGGSLYDQLVYDHELLVLSLLVFTIIRLGSFSRLTNFLCIGFLIAAITMSVKLILIKNGIVNDLGSFEEFRMSVQQIGESRSIDWFTVTLLGISTAIQGWIIYKYKTPKNS